VFHSPPRHIAQEFALNGLSVIAAITGGFLTGDSSWVAWGVGAALDSRSVWMNNMDYSYATGSLGGMPLFGKQGVAIGVGASIYNGFLRDNN
jgi:hypothetical protein